MVLFTKELHLFFINGKSAGGKFPMMAQATEQGRLRELPPSGSLASPESFAWKCTSYHRISKEFSQ
jgi:hypothetical protein